MPRNRYPFIENLPGTIWRKSARLMKPLSAYQSYPVIGVTLIVSKLPRIIKVTPLLFFQSAMKIQTIGRKTKTVM